MKKIDKGRFTCGGCGRMHWHHGQETLSKLQMAEVRVVKVIAPGGRGSGFDHVDMTVEEMADRNDVIALLEVLAENYERSLKTVSDLLADIAAREM